MIIFRCKQEMKVMFDLKKRDGKVVCMGIVAAIGAIVIIYNLIKEACEPTLPADYHRNWRLEQEDANKVRFGEMSRREFIRNMNNGKYR